MSSARSEDKLKQEEVNNLATQVQAVDDSKQLNKKIVPRFNKKQRKEEITKQRQQQEQ